VSFYHIYIHTRKIKILFEPYCRFALCHINYFIRLNNRYLVKDRGSITGRELWIFFLITPRTSVGPTAVGKAKSVQTEKLSLTFLWSWGSERKELHIYTICTHSSVDNFICSCSVDWVWH